MKNYMKLALIYILIGAFFIYWAMTHSPNASLGTIVKNELGGSYTMSSNSYYLTLFVGAVAAVFGVWKLIRRK
ncbi:hypothetical protein N6H18_17960 [Reichenbachiella agarivorans]|uniref:LPXTG-motif cell wall anchor domain-containing protein n=1 Tax=Reichenbachiella agarivorans TaxID=2979464 RepID=A0ABY6CS03_9BACT|nr:hypothetical protein [Reichenbachiella agarivorans]UXP32228.1 hypothetical protein N6H18_17960 [Reichenbachiella agarivorans]